jgi:basic membrane lipoprotein Med (substrate-binding protein (PBP1-ABC) superfamily)/DNA-binding SARP family transcriptional activator
MDLRVLGPLELTVDGRAVELGAPKQRALLAALVIGEGRLRSTDELIDAVWGDSAPRTAQHSVQLYVSTLRRAIGDPDGHLLRTHPPGYLFDLDEVDVDARRFEQMATDGLAALQGDPARALALFGDALALWRGRPFADVMYLDVVQSELRRLESLRLDVEDARDEARIRLGELSAALADLTRRVHEHPLRERTRGLHMQVLAAMGRQADALRSYRELEIELASELGIAPAPDLVALEGRILLQDPVTVGGGAIPVRNPFKGLSYFDEPDQADFHGRAEVVGGLVASVQERRTTSVIGPSGSGKSSVVRAGLVPRLRADGRVPVVMVPGSSPADSLRRALASEGIEVPPGADCGEVLSHVRHVDGLVLVVDQLEEMYLGPDDGEADRFLGCLAATANEVPGDFRLVVAIRADYSGRPLRHPTFGALFAEGMFPLRPMGPGELEEAATRPAGRSGVELAPSVVAELVADVASQPGGLPMFQFTLTELVDRSGGQRITLDEYRDLGGLDGALVSRAERAFSELDPVQSEAARQVSLRLVGLDGPVVVRRRLAAADLLPVEIDGATIRTVLEALARHRLVTFDLSPTTGEPTVEFAHDSLLTAWSRLAAWIDEGREDVGRSLVLATEVAEWVASGRSADFLPTGTRLAAFDEWRGRSTLQPTREEQRFLDAARAAEAERVASLEAREAHEATLFARARRRLWAAVLLALVLVVVGIAAVVVGGDGPRVALVYDGRGVGNWGDLVASGWDRAVDEFGIEPTEFTPLAGTSDEITSLLDQGNELVVVVGFEHALVAMEVLEDDPTAPIVVLDAPEYAGPGPSYVFASQEGAFLAGAAAAMTTETGVVGFVGGMASDLIAPFRAGFEAGAHHVDPEVVVVATYITSGFDPRTAFMRPDLGHHSADTLIGEGADVIFHAAGVSGLGVIDAAVDHREAGGRHIWVIGVDVDEYLQATDQQRPHILTSVVKRIDLAVERAITDHFEGTATSDPITLGLAEGGLALATSGGFLDEIADALDDLVVQVVAGEIAVPDEPVGPLVQSNPIGADVEVAITYGADRSCSYDGPAVLDHGVRLGLELVNHSDEQAFLGFVPMTEPMTVEEVAALRTDDGSPPPELDIFESFGLLVEAGAVDRVVSPPLADRPYAVFCTGTEPVAAAVVTAD